jgi:hypothetical protein
VLLEQFCLVKVSLREVVMLILRESVSAQEHEGRGFDSDPGRKKKAIFYLVIRKSR